MLHTMPMSRATYEKPSPVCCTVDPEKLTIAFFDKVNYTLALKCLRKNMHMTFFAEDKKGPGSS